MKSTSLVSIIIGIYNGEKYIGQCIESVLNQDYGELDIILINDGSTDASGEILDEFARQDSRIRVIHQENSGVSNSRNNALQIAKGEYICIIDQDDVLSPDYVSYFLKMCQDHDAEIALTPSVDLFWGSINEYSIKDDIQVWTGERVAVEMLYHKIVIAPWNKMISRRLIQENGLKFNPDFFCGEGFAFSVECYQRAEKIAIGKRKVYHYRVGDPESGASKFRVETIHSSINAQQYICDTFVQITPALEKAWNFSNWHTHCDCLNIMVGCGVVNKYPELYAMLKKVCRKRALCALNAPVSFQQRLRGVLFLCSPYLAAKIINCFRVRKFKKDVA